MSREQLDENGRVTFEVAIDTAGFGVYSYLMTVLTGLVIISFACISYSTTILIPTSACELNTTVAQQGLLAGGPLVGLIIGAIMWGYLGDTRGRRNMLMVCLLSSAVVNIIGSFSVNWIMLMSMQTFAAVLSSGKYTLSMTLLSESVPTAKRNNVVLMVTSIFLLSQGIMAVLAIPVIPLSFSHYISGLGIYWNSWRTLMLIYSIPCILSAVWLFFMNESPKFLYAKGEEDTALEILTTIYRINKGKSAGAFPITGFISDMKKGESAPKTDIREMFKSPLLKYTIIMTLLLVFQQIGSFAVWTPTVADQFITMTETGEGRDLNLCGVIEASLDVPPNPDAVPCALNERALLIVFGIGVMQSLVNALLSLVVNKTGRRNMVILVTALIGACGIVINLIPNALASVIFYCIFMVGILVLGLYTAITVALFPTHLRALAVAVTLTGGRISVVVAVQVVNYLLATNCEVAFYVFASIFALSAVVASFLPDDRYFGNTRQIQEKIKEEPSTDL